MPIKNVFNGHTIVFLCVVCSFIPWGVAELLGKPTTNDGSDLPAKEGHLYAVGQQCFHPARSEGRPSRGGRFFFYIATHLSQSWPHSNGVGLLSNDKNAALFF